MARYEITELVRYEVDADSEDEALQKFLHDGGEFIAVLERDVQEVDL